MMAGAARERAGNAARLCADIAEMERHRTAIKRYKLSRPLSLALAQGLLRTEWSIFDYGCGRGEDVTFLKRKGFAAEGWDPHFRPQIHASPADVVNLGYVLNVIEDVRERDATLTHAFELARRLLVVAVRVDQSLEGCARLGDGVLTSRGAFQKLYTQSEFKGYVQAVVQARPYMAALGVAYVFRDPALEAEFLADAASRRTAAWRDDVLQGFRKDRLAQQFLRRSRELGRAPIDEEFPRWSTLIERFGPPNRIARIAAALVAAADIDTVRAAKRDDLLLYFAMLRLQGLKSPPFRALPAAIQADIRMLWPSYQDAVADGERFLFAIGRPELVREACATATVGKRLPDALYLHRSSAAQMPLLLRLVQFAATQIVGDVEHDIIKLNVDGRAVSFLKYSDFDIDPHPRLEYSIRAHLPTADHTFRDYRDSTNPPILHRKDMLVDFLYPHYEAFRALSEAEERAGILSRPDIGFKRNWESLLTERGLEIAGHTLRPIPAGDGTTLTA